MLRQYKGCAPPYFKSYYMIEEMIEAKVSQYMSTYGQAESVEIFQRLQSSKLFLENLDIALNRHEVPSGKTLTNIIRGCHYKFILANKRKIYFSSLFFLKVLYDKYEQLGFPINEERFAKSLLEVCEINAS